MEHLWTILSAGFDVFLKLAQLALEYIKVLAWPVAVLLIALLYKRPLSSLLDRVRKGSFLGVTFDADVRDVATALTSIADQVSHSPKPGADSGATDSAPSGGVNDLQEFSALSRPDSETARLVPPAYASGDPLLTDESIQRIRRNRVDTAWHALKTAVLHTAMQANVPSGRVDEIVEALLHKGLVDVATWRSAINLARIYEAINDNVGPLSEGATHDFILGTRSLRVILESIDETLRLRRVVAYEKNATRNATGSQAHGLDDNPEE